MKIELRQIGKKQNGSFSVMEITIITHGATIVEDIANLHGGINTDFIESLRQIADELEEQNNLLNK